MGPDMYIYGIMILHNHFHFSCLLELTDLSLVQNARCCNGRIYDWDWCSNPSFQLRYNL